MAAPAGEQASASSSQSVDGPQPANQKPSKALPALTRFRRSPLGRKLNRWMRRSVDIGIRVFGITMKVIGPCFALLALALISFCTYTYFVYVLPMLGDGTL